jgi:hypothetical protein
MSGLCTQKKFRQLNDESFEVRGAKGGWSSRFVGAQAEADVKQGRDEEEAVLNDGQLGSKEGSARRRQRHHHHHRQAAAQSRIVTGQWTRDAKDEVRQPTGSG